MNALSKLVGRDVGQVSRWTKRPDWPFSRTGPWQRKQVPDILRWVADAIAPSAAAGEPGEPSDGTGDEMKDLRKDKLRKEIRRLIASAETAETALARERGQLYDAAPAEREMATLATIVRNGFQNLPSQLVAIALSGGMPHEAAPQFQQQAGEIINGILRHLSRDGTPETDEASPIEVPGEPVPA